MKGAAVVIAIPVGDDPGVETEPVRDAIALLDVLDDRFDGFGGVLAEVARVGRGVSAAVHEDCFHHSTHLDLIVWHVIAVPLLDGVLAYIAFQQGRLLNAAVIDPCASARRFLLLLF